jgi:L-fuculokinase
MSLHDRRATVVLDIGKTNVKLTLLAAQGATLAVRRCPNTIVGDGPYPHHDTERIWEWLLSILAEFSGLASISAIVPVTHGATAALVDDHGLVLPVLDYESTLPQSTNEGYRAVRPPFGESLSPDLPAGLNLGRQLFWLARTFPKQFSVARYILTYPQYWAWRLSGVAASELTSLGCHTDLWNPSQGTFSSLITALGWHSLIPPLQAASNPLGTLLPELIARTGLDEDCQVLCGIHDSNASLLRYLDANPSAPCTVLSTGTWVIAAAFGQELGILDEKFDMLANITARGQAVACMRFMGGREFSALAGMSPTMCTFADFEKLIVQNTLALPSFSDSGGPFVGQAGTITGPAPDTAQERYALATIYCVLMTDYCLSVLHAQGAIVVEGSFTDNPFFGALLALTRTQQTVWYSGDTSGTTCGGWLLHHPDGVPGAPLEQIGADTLPGWTAYRHRWLELIDSLQ